jgi:hypothetical protein
MVLEWFSGARDDSVDDLVRRKRYGKAVKLLRAELEKRKNDRRLRLRLGEILVLAGERDEGLRLLSRVADDLALVGQVAQAIAVLKKIEAIDPGREDVEDKLAYLVERKARPKFDPWAGSGQKRESGAGASDEAPPGEGLEIGFEPSPRAQEAQSPASSAPPAAEAAAAEADALPLDAPPALEPLSGQAPLGDAAPATTDAAVTDDAPLSDEAMRDEILSLIEDVLQPTATPAPPAPASPPGGSASEGVVDTPLFRSFPRDELAALIRGLRLLTFQPGEIVVSEGEAGASLFVLTSGGVRAYVRNAAHHQVVVRELKEGDIFGEISVLTGQPRSATVVTATRCELLELDKPTLDRIAQTHPHVRQVLQEFYDQRADNTLETLVRSMGRGGR